METSLMLFGLLVSALSATALRWATRATAVEPVRAIDVRSASRRRGG